jgi:hypothetical protein
MRKGRIDTCLYITMLLLILSSASIFADDFIIDEPVGRAGGQSTVSLPVSRRSYDYAIPSIGSAQTADNLRRGDFITEFIMYDNGGFGARLMVGIFDMLSIGVFENIDGLIGSDDIHLNIPGAIIKFSVFEPSRPFNLAIGFDSFAYGQGGSFVTDGGNPATIYGVYAAGSYVYEVFRAKNIVSFGLRFPLLPSDFRNIANTSFYAGATLGTKFINAGFTVENMYLDFSRPEEILPSLVLNFTPIPSFSIGLSLQYLFSEDRVNRILILSYKTRF